MGLMSRLFPGTAIRTNSHSIHSNEVLKPHPQAVTPFNAPKWGTFRSQPAIPQARFFSQEEANALGTLVEQRKGLLGSTKEAFKHLGSLEELDVGVHQLFRGYQAVVSEAELQKVEANTKLATQLHGQRAQYAKLKGTLETAALKASDQIREQQWKLREGRKSRKGRG